MSNSKTIVSEQKKGGPPSRTGFYSLISQYTEEAVNRLVDIMRNSRNESLKFAAARAIIDKTIADVKAIELTGANGEPFSVSIKLDVAGGYIPRDRVSEVGTVNAPPAGSNQGPPQIQSPGLAPPGQKDDNSSNGTGQAGTV